jgi:DNA-directed RNA polymerase specialized sigma24 family protein
MVRRPSPIRVVWLNPLQRDGNPIGQELLDAATEMEPEAQTVVAVLLRDIDRTAEIMELAVQLVWRKLKREVVPLTKTKFYLLRTFYRLVHRIAWREGWFIYSDPDILQIDLEEEDKVGDPDRKMLSLNATRFPDRDPERVQRRTEKARKYWDPNRRFGSANDIERMVDLFRLLQRLNDRERLILELRWIEEDDCESISQRPGMSAANVRVIACRAMRKLSPASPNEALWRDGLRGAFQCY